MSIRSIIAVLAGKFANFLSQRLGKKGSALPGKVARWVSPHILKVLAGQVGRDIIMITGTNGKTTVTNLAAKLVQAGGFRIVHNEEGANMITGVTAAFVKAANWRGRLKCDYALLEIDEVSLPKVLAEVVPSVLVVTNFFRDQLDRYGELDMTVRVIQNALPLAPAAHLILNGDDPLVVQLADAEDRSVLFYGLSPAAAGGQPLVGVRETQFCPRCGRELNYDFRFYGQLGIYACVCGFIRPVPDVEIIETAGRADPALAAEGLAGRIRYHDGQEAAVTLNTQGFYNYYNLAAAFATGLALGLDPQTMAAGFARYEPAIGRMECFWYRNKPVILNLVKNPTGYTEGLLSLCQGAERQDVFMALNDNDADGCDISWLWDVDFEFLADRAESVTTFVCTGLRGEDMALRLKYAGIPVRKIAVTADLQAAAEQVLNGEGQRAYFFSTYTALWSTQKILLKLTTKEESSHAAHLSSVS